MPLPTSALPIPTATASGKATLAHAAATSNGVSTKTRPATQSKARAAREAPVGVGRCIAAAHVDVGLGSEDLADAFAEELRGRDVGGGPHPIQHGPQRRPGRPASAGYRVGHEYDLRFRERKHLHTDGGRIGDSAGKIGRGECHDVIVAGPAIDLVGGRGPAEVSAAVGNGVDVVVPGTAEDVIDDRQLSHGGSADGHMVVTFTGKLP